LVLDIIKATRVDDNVIIVINTLDMPNKDLNKNLRRLKSLYGLARDSKDLPLDDPIIIVGSSSFPMRKHDFLPEWSISVKKNSTLKVLYNERYHDLGLF